MGHTPLQYIRNMHEFVASKHKAVLRIQLQAVDRHRGTRGIKSIVSLEPRSGVLRSLLSMWTAPRFAPVYLQCSQNVLTDSYMELIPAHQLNASGFRRMGWRKNVKRSSSNPSSSSGLKYVTPSFSSIWQMVPSTNYPLRIYCISPSTHRWIILFGVTLDVG